MLARTTAWPWARPALVGLVALLALAAAPAASAHAVLLRTEPANDEVAAASPERVVLHFDEPVESAFGSVRVFDGNGERVDTGDLSRPEPQIVAVALRPGLARGTYTVAWRAISADSDPIRGAFVFHVEAPGQQPSGIAAEVLEDTPLLVSVLYAGGRFLDYLLLLLSAGGAVVLAVVLGSADPALRRRLYRLLALAAAALVPVALAGIVLQGAAASGVGLGEAVRWEQISAVADTRFGEMALLRAGLAAVLTLVAALLALRRPGRIRAGSAVTLALAVAMLATPVASGHASLAGSSAVASDLAHVVAASAWTGGLAFVVLALALAAETRWELASRAVPRFSNLAVVSVGALVVAGAVNGYLQIRAWRGLWETTYGLLLLAKIGLVLPLLALGAYNNRFAVPRLRAGIASALERRRFLRAAGAELVVMTAVVGVTAVLVNAPPARTEVMMHGPAAATVALGPLRAHVTVEPARAGRNRIHIELAGAGDTMPDVDEVRVVAALPSKQIGPLRMRARPVHDGFAVARATLPLEGHWQLRIEARRGEFDLFTGTLSVQIRKES